MLVHLDTSLLVDAFTGPRRSLAAVRAATARREVLTFSTIVLYEWLRGPRVEEEHRVVRELFPLDRVAVFGPSEAEIAARLYAGVRRARERQAGLAIAACAMAQRALLWTLNEDDFRDIPGLALYHDSRSLKAES